MSSQNLKILSTSTLVGFQTQTTAVRKERKTVFTLTEVENEILNIDKDFVRLQDNSSDNNFCGESSGSDNKKSDFVIRTPSDFLVPCKKDNSASKTSVSRRLCRSETNSSICDSDSNNSSASEKYCSSPYRHKTRKHKRLHPIGVFWDIENCQVPKGKSASAVVKNIRDAFFKGHREAEFMVVCDVRKENSYILQELNDAQVNLVHVSSTCKNAADEKLRQSMRRFADTHKFPCSMILISSDINFASDLSDLRHRKRIHVILLHNASVSDALVSCANEHFLFTTITESAPLRENKISTPTQQQVEVVINNLPVGYDHVRLRNRLRQLSDNCGGRVVYVSVDAGEAIIRFASFDCGLRAQKRMEGEDVYGHKISVGYPRVATWDKSQSPTRHLSVRKALPITESDQMSQQRVYPINFGNELTQYVMPQAALPPAIADNWLFDNKNSVVPHYSLFNEQKDQISQYIQFSSENIENASAVRYIRGRSENLLQNSQLPLPLQDSAEKSYIGKYPKKMSNRNRSDSRGNSSRSTSNHPYTPYRHSWLPKPESGSRSSSRGPSECSEDNETTFQPIQNHPSSAVRRDSISQPVDLVITNLDNRTNMKDLRKILLQMFREHVNVVQINLSIQSDGNAVANVRVPSAQAAQYAISKLQRKKIGTRRMTISYANSPTINLQQLKAQVVALLQDIPGKKLPLFQFRELFETRYHTSISASELYRLRDICVINEAAGRTIMLNEEVLSSDSPSPNFTFKEANVEISYCQKHVISGTQKGWAELETEGLPNIRIGLLLFTNKIHSLLMSHNGCLPLYSLQACYEAEMKEPLPVDETGVPLEHLVTCVPLVELNQGPNKCIVWATHPSHDDYSTDDSGSVSGLGGTKSSGEPLTMQLALFSRELVDLLRTSPDCRISFNKFIPAYHHHFGRQCRVADYGFMKLIDLFESLPHVVQVIGEGNQRILTLSHRAQIRRFTADLMRILKSSVSRQVSVKNFPASYERVFGKTWDVAHYGVCELPDLLAALPENTIVITGTGEDTIISLPKREQTPEEVTKTKRFASEVVELLRHTPQCMMLFNRFVPAYHHHFGHQCRVSDYGFTKLIELFEAIPDVVEIEYSNNDERFIRLSLSESLKVLGDHITEILGDSEGMTINDIAAKYLIQHGCALQASAYGCSSLDELFQKLQTVQFVRKEDGCVLIKPMKKIDIRVFGLRIWRIMADVPGFMLSLVELQQVYKTKYGTDSCDIGILRKLRDIIKITWTNTELFIELTPLYMFVAQSYSVLINCKTESTPFVVFENLYLRRFGQNISPHTYGHTNLLNLFETMSDIFTLTTSNNTYFVTINKNLSNSIAQTKEAENGNDKKNEVTPNKNFTLDENYLEWKVKNIGQYEPPKPDTPPSHGAKIWGEWHTPPSFLNDFSVQLPPMETVELPESPGSLISPAKYLMSACPNPLHPYTPLRAPPPYMLPKPDPTCFSIKSPQIGLQDSPTQCKSKRKSRLAARFDLPIKS